MVRGPMIAEVTAGWRMTNATAIWMRVSPAWSSDCQQAESLSTSL